MASPETQEAAPPPLTLDRELLQDLQRTALELAREAGAEIRDALARGISVEYKTDTKGQAAPTDPVSEVDHAVEARIRGRLAEGYPAHGIVGEEVDEHPSPEDEFVWAIDPVDGTTNFVNGFPLFAASVGVLYRGHPVAGAIWCAASRGLGPGVYHASVGSGLWFEDERVDSAPANTGVRRRLSAAPGGSPGSAAQWDNRVTGSAAIECAFAAAGIFASARFAGIHLWDVAAGAVLVREAGREFWVRGRSGWEPLERFEPPERVKEDRAPTLRDWSQPVVLGTADAVETLTARDRRPGIWRRARQLLLPI